MEQKGSSVIPPKTADCDLDHNMPDSPRLEFTIADDMVITVLDASVLEGNYREKVICICGRIGAGCRLF